MTGRPKLLSLMTGATLLAAGGAAQAQSLDAAVLAASCVNCHAPTANRAVRFRRLPAVPPSPSPHR